MELMKQMGISETFSIVLLAIGMISVFLLAMFEIMGYIDNKRYRKWLNIGDGNTSDGHHTFNELYHHRAVLFSVICNANPAISWKSKLHHDGMMYDDRFIVGIETPQGQATYHYDIATYWEMFNVQEFEKAPEWDGHTSEEAIERIRQLSITTNKESDEIT